MNLCLINHGLFYLLGHQTAMPMTMQKAANLSVVDILASAIQTGDVGLFLSVLGATLRLMAMSISCQASQQQLAWLGFVRRNPR
jgi:hypothetical protein